MAKKALPANHALLAHAASKGIEGYRWFANKYPFTAKSKKGTNTAKVPPKVKKARDVLAKGYHHLWIAQEGFKPRAGVDDKKPAEKRAQNMALAVKHHTDAMKLKAQLPQGYAMVFGQIRKINPKAKRKSAALLKR
jgi:hypothetical protein